VEIDRIVKIDFILMDHDFIRRLRPFLNACHKKSTVVLLPVMCCFTSKATSIRKE